MPQHFLLSSPARSLSLAQVIRMSDAEAEAMFRQIRWPDTNGEPVCPRCGVIGAYECRRPTGALRFRCKGCKADYTVEPKLDISILPNTCAEDGSNLIRITQSESDLVVCPVHYGIGSYKEIIEQGAGFFQTAPLSMRKQIDDIWKGRE